MPHSKLNLGLRGGWDYGLSGEATFNYVGAATHPIGDGFIAGSIWVAVPNERVASYSIVNLASWLSILAAEISSGIYMRTAECAVSVFNAINDEHKEYALGRHYWSTSHGVVDIEVLRRCSTFGQRPICHMVVQYGAVTTFVDPCCSLAAIRDTVPSTLFTLGWICLRFGFAC